MAGVEHGRHAGRAQRADIARIGADQRDCLVIGGIGGKAAHGSAKLARNALAQRAEIAARQLAFAHGELVLRNSRQRAREVINRIVAARARGMAARIGRGDIESDIGLLGQLHLLRER